jgi:cell division protein FtsW
VTALDTPGSSPRLPSRLPRTSRPAAPRTRRASSWPVRSAPPEPDESAGGDRVPLLARPMTSYYLIGGASALLLGLGLVMVLSASSVTSYATSGSSFSIFVKQLMWVAIGLPLLWIASRTSTRALRMLSYPLLLVAVGGLLLVLVPGVGVSAYGATRWIGVGSFTIQPSELAKLALVLWGADLLVRKRRLLREWRHLLIPLLPVASVLAGLVMLQPDLGTTLVLVAILMTLLWVVGSPARLFAGLLALIGVLVSYLAVMEPYRLERLASFADPFKDSQDTGWQAVQGLYALASGGWWGVGLGASREKWSYLPNAHTDFILAIIGEELGLVGTLLVVVLFGVLAYGGIRVAQRSADPFGRLVAAGLTAWLVGQALINMGAVVGLLPITGIPLPLISFGGSSLMLTMVAIGILLSLAKTEPAAAQVLAARAASRSAHRSATGHRRRWSLRRRSKGPAGSGPKGQNGSVSGSSKGSKSKKRSKAQDDPVKAKAARAGRRGRVGRAAGSRESRSGSRAARGRRIGLARLSRGSSKRSRRRQPSR